MAAPDSTPAVALVIPADQPPDLMLEAARSAEDAGLEELWLWEDCFAASGIGPAAAILSGTRSLRVGIGLMPVPLRVPSLTAMEIASLARMFPGRFLPGLGHGVQEWMAQIGHRVESPLTLLREHTSAISRLLRGEEVSTQGRYVVLDKVQLRFPPEEVPPLFVGGRGPKTLAVAGELADGVILDDATTRSGKARPHRVREALDIVGEARASAGRDGTPEVMAFAPTGSDLAPGQLAEVIEELATAGATRVGAFAGGVDGPPGAGRAILDFVPVLAEARRLLR